MLLSRFNVRVYGLFIKDTRLLVTQEKIAGKIITKFPGGGLELGESTIDCLKRELTEELRVSVDVTSHFYTTDFFVQSAFDDSQVISVYYQITSNEEIKQIGENEKIVNGFNWVSLSELDEQLFTFPIDKHVARLLKNNFNKG
jgi:8-oxo-dGTP pyrophosphatase MutT (NUDIX family)